MNEIQRTGCTARFRKCKRITTVALQTLHIHTERWHCGYTLLACCRQCHPRVKVMGICAHSALALHDALKCWGTLPPVDADAWCEGALKVHCRDTPTPGHSLHSAQGTHTLSALDTYPILFRVPYSLSPGYSPHSAQDTHTLSALDTHPILLRVPVLSQPWRRDLADFRWCDWQGRRRLGCKEKKVLLYTTGKATTPKDPSLSCDKPNPTRNVQNGKSLYFFVQQVRIAHRPMNPNYS